MQDDVETNLREFFGLFVLTVDEGKMRRIVSYSDVSMCVARQYLLIHLALRGCADTMSLSFRNVTKHWFCRIYRSASVWLPDCCHEVATGFRVLAQVTLNQQVTTRHSEVALALLVPLRVYSQRTSAEFARPASSARAGMSAGGVMMASRQS